MPDFINLVRPRSKKLLMPRAKNSKPQESFIPTSGDERTISIDQVDRARTVFVWEAAPKPGSGGKKGVRGKSSGSGARSGADSAATTADLSADNDDLDDTDFDDTDIHDDQEHSES